MEERPSALRHDAEDTKPGSGKEKLEAAKSRAKKPEAIGTLVVERRPATGKRAPERIGRVLVTSEKTDDTAETASVEPLTSKRIDTLNRAELMALGEKVTIDGSSLRQMYETYLIGERGMRRIIAEYQNGGDLRAALRREVAEREMDFERDPVIRDTTVPAAVPVDTSNDALEKLLQKAAVSVADSGEEAAFYKAQSKYETSHQQRQRRQQRRLMDFSLAFIIIVLVILVIVLFLTHG